MIVGMYSVRDKAVEAFLPPFFAPTDNAALRMIRDALSDEKSGFARHASDYALFRIGAFDDATGAVQVDVDSPLKIVDLLAIADVPAS